MNFPTVSHPFTRVLFMYSLQGLDKPFGAAWTVDSTSPSLKIKPFPSVFSVDVLLFIYSPRIYTVFW